MLNSSQIDTFLTCQRKWGFIYKDGLEVLPSEAMAFGIRVHKVLEQYLKGYQIKYDTAESRIASAGFQFLSKNIPYENIEKKFFFKSSGHTFFGTPDFFEHVGSQTWVLGDHKTCSSLSSALSSEELKKNTQANIYSKWLIQEKQAEVINLKWIYYQRNKPKAKCVEAKLTKEEVNHNFTQIIQVADNIVNLISKASPILPKNNNSCFKYGKCEFYSHCYGKASLALSKVNEITMDNKISSENSFHLFIDCLPIKTAFKYKQTIELSELLKPVLQKLESEKELKHYRLAGYGQHVGLISSYLAEYLHEHSFDQYTAILSSSKTPEGCDTLQTLSSKASAIFKGFS